MIPKAAYPPGSPALRQMICSLALLLWLTASSAGPLSRHERVLFVPNTAQWQADGQILARIDAWIYQEERRPGLSALLAHHLDIDLDKLNATDRQRFYARTQLFRVDSESSKQTTIRLDCYQQDCPQHQLPRSNFAGRASSLWRLSATAEPADGQNLSFSVVLRDGDPRKFHGSALLVPEHGLSVVSDIDDTIKISQVRDRRELLLNTFAREFVVAPGMAARYQQLATNADTRFHYVSSSPLQLYPLIAAFISSAGFPEGSVHLRESTSILNVISSHRASRKHKMQAISTLLMDFPQRQFMLIGDSGESDPEIYAELARAHPKQITAIRIRDVSGEAADSPRYQKTFAQLPAELWEIYPSDGGVTAN